MHVCPFDVPRPIKYRFIADSCLSLHHPLAHPFVPRSQTQRQLQLSLEAHGRYITTLMEQEGFNVNETQAAKTAEAEIPPLPLPFHAVVAASSKALPGGSTANVPVHGDQALRRVPSPHAEALGGDAAAGSSHEPLVHLRYMSPGLGQAEAAPVMIAATAAEDAVGGFPRGQSFSDLDGLLMGEPEDGLACGRSDHGERDADAARYEKRSRLTPPPL